MRLRFAVAVVAAVAALFFLDRACYGWLIFQVENRSGWDSFPWYNFERRFREIEAFRRQHPDRPLVLVPGSSISKYSIQERLLEDLLRAEIDPEIRVFALQHASMQPADLYFYAPRIAALQPDLILMLTGPADLDLERYTPPWEAGPIYDDALADQYISLRRPGAVFYPRRLALELPDASVDQRLSWWLRSFFYASRFRDEWKDPLLFARSTDRHLRRYLYYQGRPLAELLWRDGFSGPCFTIPPRMLRRGVLDLETPPALAAAGAFVDVAAIPFLDGKRKDPVSALEESLREEGGAGRPMALSEYSELAAALNDRWQAPLACQPNDATPLQRIELDRVGWRSYTLPALAPGQAYHFRLSHTVDLDGTVRAFPAAGRGLRLPGNLGLEAARVDDSMVRRPALEDYRLLSMSAAVYGADYGARLENDRWREAQFVAFHQLNHLRIARYFTRWYDWHESYQAQKLRGFVQAMPANTRFVFIDNPENPLARADYGPVWRKAYQGFLGDLAKTPAAGGAFVDLSQTLKEQYFLDPHHLSYAGVLRMAPDYVRAIKGLWPRGDRSTPAAVPGR